MISVKSHNGTGGFAAQENLGQTELNNMTRRMPELEKKYDVAAPKGSVQQDVVSVADIWQKVAGTIDVRQATPHDIMDVSQQLYKANAISYDDYINLSFQPELSLESPSDSKPFSHEKKDYIALWQHKQDNVIRHGGNRSQIEEAQRIQSILKYVDSLKPNH